MAQGTEPTGMGGPMGGRGGADMVLGGAGGAMGMPPNPSLPAVVPVTPNRLPVLPRGAGPGVMPARASPALSARYTPGIGR